MKQPQLTDAVVLATAERLIMSDVSLVQPMPWRIGEHAYSGFRGIVLANRGYYRDSMGAPGENDCGIFDDACFLIDQLKGDIHRFRWNTDPSRLGYNKAIQKGYAILQPGIWPFYRGSHKGKSGAWRQFEEELAESRQLKEYFADVRRKGHFRIWRGKFGEREERGYYAINIHWGSGGSTSSWGCQTAPAEDWSRFQKASYEIASDQPFLPYILTDEKLQ